MNKITQGTAKIAYKTQKLLPEVTPVPFKRKKIFFFLLLVFASFSLFFSLRHGSTNSIDYTILMKLRFPRALSAFVSGGLLALSGVLIQLLLQNPLADPYILGISGGAALTTLLMLFFGISGITLTTGAWCGSLFAMLLMTLLARKHHFETHQLLLSGILLASGFSACISFILLISPDTSLHSMLFWLCGDLNDAHYPITALVVLIFGSVITMLLAPGLNLLYRGEREAQALGLACKQYRICLYVLCSLFTAAAVTISGTIGFIGLIVPHITRKLVGFDHRILLPASILIGGALLTFADTCARIAFAPQQIPVGIILAFIGIPLFIWLLRK